jgi:thiol:disulfide interchange protein DsbC
MLIRTAIIGTLWLGMTILTGGYVNAATLMERAQPLFPQAKIDAVEPTPIPGLYEVRSGKTILYMDEKGRYVLLGELYDFQARKNLTAERILAMRATRFEDLPLQHAVRLGPERGTRRLAVFDDVDCPFCRRFHEETLPSLLQEGVTVYVFLFPLERLHPQAKAKSEAIWCSNDRAQALEAAFRNPDSRSSQTPPADITRASQKCEAPLAAIQAIATQIGVTGTPTLVLDSGEIIEGFVTKDALQAKWQQRKGR